jgi:hypothetical protein
MPLFKKWQSGKVAKWKKNEKIITESIFTNIGYMEHDSLSAMALDTPSMVKNKIFSMHASRVYSEVQKLNLSTVQEREAEYVKRMTVLPNHIYSINSNELNETIEPEKVRYTFSMPKSGSSMSRASITSSMSSASITSSMSSASITSSMSSASSA